MLEATHAGRQLDLRWYIAYGVVWLFHPNLRVSKTHDQELSVRQQVGFGGALMEEFFDDPDGDHDAQTAAAA